MQFNIVLIEPEYPLVNAGNISAPVRDETSCTLSDLLGFEISDKY